VDKSPDAFRTISEVAADLDLPQHVLRFWETRFVQIRPLKRGGGRRYYRPDDVELLKGIRHLLYGEGYTIRGVQRILKEQGVRFVMNVWQDGAPQPPAGGARLDEGAGGPEPAYDDEPLDEPADLPPDDAYSPYAPHHVAPTAQPREPTAADFAVPMVRPAEPRPPEIRPGLVPPRAEPRFDAPAGEDRDGLASMAQRFAPRFIALADPEPAENVAPPRPVTPATPPRPIVRPAAELQSSPTEEGEAVADRSSDDDTAPDLGGLRASRLPAGLRPPEPAEAPRLGIGQFFDRLRPGGARESESPAARTVQTLSRDEIRRLQSTLFELLECKRLLDQVR
jgi:DNA-binding transcriptional MerR regulator